MPLQRAPDEASPKKAQQAVNSLHSYVPNEKKMIFDICLQHCVLVCPQDLGLRAIDTCHCHVWTTCSLQHGWNCQTSYILWLGIQNKICRSYIILMFHYKRKIKMWNCGNCHLFRSWTTNCHQEHSVQTKKRWENCSKQTSNLNVEPSWLWHSVRLRGIGWSFAPKPEKCPLLKKKAWGKQHELHYIDHVTWIFSRNS